MKITAVSTVSLVSFFVVGPCATAFQSTRVISRDVGRVVTLPSHPPSIPKAFFPRKLSSISTSTTSTTSRFMFGNLFGGGGSVKVVPLVEPVTVYTHADGTDLELDGLGDYITKWAGMFTNGGIALTTPVIVTALPSSPSSRGVQLLFRDTNTGYKSSKEIKNEDRTTDNDNNNDNNDQATKKKKKDGKVKQGGVEIVVRKTTTGDLEVVASRCEIEEGTIIKEMSEQTILSELHQAIKVWKRETQ